MKDGPPKILLIHVHNRKRIQFNLSGIYPMLPLGIAMLGAQLESEGFPVELFDLSLKENQKVDVGRKVREGGPSPRRSGYGRTGGFDLVGLSATLFSLPETLGLAKQIKKSAPKTRLVVGGPATIFDAETLYRYMPEVDAFVFGEGEQTIVKLAETVGDEKALFDIPGIAFRQNGAIRVNSPAEPLRMDDLPLPARHLLPRGRYRMHPPFNRYSPITQIETSRGCPYQCAFCSIPKNWRVRSIEHVMSEVHHVLKTENIREIHFVDPTFTADRERALHLAEELAPLGIHFTFKTRPDLVDEQLLAHMKKAGSYLISYGVETFEEEGMEYLNKDVEAGLSRQRIRQTKQAGMDVLAYLLIGNPGDTFGKVARSVRRLLDAGCDFALFSDLFPDPSVPITKNAIKRERLSKRQIEEFYFLQVPLPGKTTLAGLPAKQVRRWVLFCFLYFYFSPRTLWRMLSKVETYRDLLGFIRAGLHLLVDVFIHHRTV